MPGVEIHDRHQVEEAFLQGDVGDVGRPDLVHDRDLLEVHQTGKWFRWFAGDRGARLLVDSS